MGTLPVGLTQSSLTDVCASCSVYDELRALAELLSSVNTNKQIIAMPAFGYQEHNLWFLQVSASQNALKTSTVKAKISVKVVF